MKYFRTGSSSYVQEFFEREGERAIGKESETKQGKKRENYNNLELEIKKNC